MRKMEEQSVLQRRWRSFQCSSICLLVHSEEKTAASKIGPKIRVCFRTLKNLLVNLDQCKLPRKIKVLPEGTLHNPQGGKHNMQSTLRSFLLAVQCFPRTGCYSISHETNLQQGHGSYVVPLNQEIAQLGKFLLLLLLRSLSMLFRKLCWLCS